MPLPMASTAISGAATLHQVGIANGIVPSRISSHRSPGPPGASGHRVRGPAMKTTSSPALHATGFTSAGSSGLGWPPRCAGHDRSGWPLTKAKQQAAGGDHPGGEVTRCSTAYLGRLGSILAFVQVERLRTRTYTCQAAVPFAFSCQCSPAKCRQPGPRRLLEPGQPLTTGRPRRPAAGVDCPVRK